MHEDFIGVKRREKLYEMEYSRSRYDENKCFL